ncbi:hypothetical protein FW778_13395 [Ginsengibacter hankyongi]|uniref:Uncharacterized protein n=1 Tax=Ginsengibacter hankyongi TaxID=2607284 RepID=A0A5J5IEX5_9BACT|nr:hypothetical protein [Ginsengibacter hankyongi]KAA9038548.1 hypothetical protein FW778_13395 [Ginsengibacter hankyongi]
MKSFTLNFILPGLFIFFICGCSSGFGPDYDKAEIKQNIGGTLICNSVHTADIQNYQYDVSYEYKDSNDSIFDIGSGTYYNREWNKDEQLQGYNDWTILKTGDSSGTDKVIVGNLKTNKWTEYRFTSKNIEKESMWRSLKIHPLSNYCCSETFIDKIKDGQIQLHYKFRTSEGFITNNGGRKIYYQINNSTGQPVMTKIE